MRTGTKELIGFPACMLIVILGVYGIINMLMALPSPSSAEDWLVGMLIIGFGVLPLFFGILIAVVAVCMWMATSDRWSP